MGLSLTMSSFRRRTLAPLAWGLGVELGFISSPPTEMTIPTISVWLEDVDTT